MPIKNPKCPLHLRNVSMSRDRARMSAGIYAAGEKANKPACRGEPSRQTVERCARGPQNRGGRLRVKNPGSLFATRLATRRCESSETSGGRGRLSLNPHDDPSSSSSASSFCFSSFLVFVVHFSPRVGRLLFVHTYVRSSRPSWPIFSRTGDETHSITRSRGRIRKRKGRRTEDVARPIATHR